MGVDRTLFVDDVPDDCICCICQEVLEDPKETITCQHAFCQSCILAWLEERPSCPSCRCPLSLGDLVALHRVWRDKLNRLRLRCRNYHAGCEAVLWLEKLDYHNASCPYTRVNCPHSPCGEVVLRSRLSSHVESCEYRHVACKNCQVMVLALSVKDHECIPALREELFRRLENHRREWSDSIRVMRREQRKLEEKVTLQANQIAELRGGIAVLMGRRKAPSGFPTMEVTGNAIRRVSAHPSSSVATGHARGTRSTRRDSRPMPPPGDVSVSLPRLAPLHTHMSLSRNSSRYSGKEAGSCSLIIITVSGLDCNLKFIHDSITFFILPVISIHAGCTYRSVLCISQMPRDHSALDLMRKIQAETLPCDLLTSACVFQSPKGTHRPHDSQFVVCLFIPCIAVLTYS